MTTNRKTPEFVPGAELSEAFYREAVRPILDRRYPGLEYSAGKLHRGSEVLGFDTPRSMDHDWGPSKLDLFLWEADRERLSGEIREVLSAELPREFRGFPTGFVAVEGATGGALGHAEAEGVRHRIDCTTTARFFRGYIGLDPLAPVAEVDWLVIAPQFLRTIASGKVFHDGLGELRRARERLRWYPRDVWLYLLASQWGRIAQEEPFMARCGDVGDELGSRVVAARMIAELMKLCFLMERSYWPYSKWFGTAFSELRCAGKLRPLFDSVLDIQTWKEREEHLSVAYLHVMGMHNELELTSAIEPEIAQFYGRPYRVPRAARFGAALYECIDSETVRAWPKDVGGVGQFVHSTDVLDRISRCRKIRALYRD